MGTFPTTMNHLWRQGPPSVVEGLGIFCSVVKANCLHEQIRWRPSNPWVQEDPHCWMGQREMRSWLLSVERSLQVAEQQSLANYGSLVQRPGQVCAHSSGNPWSAGWLGTPKWLPALVSKVLTASLGQFCLHPHDSPKILVPYPSLYWLCHLSPWGWGSYSQRLL